MSNPIDPGMFFCDEMIRKKVYPCCWGSLYVLSSLVLMFIHFRCVAWSFGLNELRMDWTQSWPSPSWMLALQTRRNREKASNKYFPSFLRRFRFVRISLQHSDYSVAAVVLGSGQIWIYPSSQDKLELLKYLTALAQRETLKTLPLRRLSLGRVMPPPL